MKCLIRKLRGIHQNLPESTSSPRPVYKNRLLLWNNKEPTKNHDKGWGDNVVNACHASMVRSEVFFQSPARNLCLSSHCWGGGDKPTLGLTGHPTSQGSAGNKQTDPFSKTNKTKVDGPWATPEAALRPPPCMHVHVHLHKDKNLHGNYFNLIVSKRREI